MSENDQDPLSPEAVKAAEEALAANDAPEEDIPEAEKRARHMQQLRNGLDDLSTDEMSEAVIALQTNNAEVVGRLREGGQELDTVIIMMQRLEALIQFGLDDETRLRVDLMFERQMAGLLAEAEHQARVQKITAGLNDAPSDILRGGKGLPQPRKRS